MSNPLRTRMSGFLLRNASASMLVISETVVKTCALCAHAFSVQCLSWTLRFLASSSAWMNASCV